MLPTYFISHGGGPWPWMKDQMPGLMDRLEASLQDIPRQIGGKPEAVLMISGHWEAPTPAVMAHPQPPMVYDYSGFPPHTYQIRYAAPGSPVLAARVKALLDEAGLGAELDGTRGFDHGMFAPMAVLYPAADVPTVQLSLRSGYDPEFHLAMGRALATLRSEGILIIGSGLSYHNLRQMGRAAAAQASAAFDAWLRETLVDFAPDQRSERLRRWSAAPAAREAHPQEDHLLPLMVAVGAAEQEPATVVYHESTFFGNVTVSSYRFGDSVPGPA